MSLNSKRMWKWLSRLLVALLVLVIVAGIAFVAWASTPYGALMPEAEMALLSDDSVTVTQQGWIAFTPNLISPTAGVILFPGGRVQAEAYAPLARQIAESGYLAVIVHVPLNLALFDTSAAMPVIDNYSAVQTWAVGGHSLGGVAAGIFAGANLDRVGGLVLLASYPIDDALINSGIQVLSIYGSNDRIAAPEEVVKSSERLPASAELLEIAGGNHSQFGYYGFQEGDGVASIPYAEQTAQVADAIISLLERLNSESGSDS